MMRGQPAAAQGLPAAAHQCIFSLSMHIYIYEFYHHVFNINICILLTQAGVLLTVHSFMNLCCRRRAAVLPPPPPPPLEERRVGGFLVIGQAEPPVIGQAEPPVIGQAEPWEDVEATLRWRILYWKLQRIFFKRRCWAWLGCHLKNLPKVSKKKPKQGKD